MHITLCVHFIQITNDNIGYNIAMEAVLWKNYENMSYRYYCMKICEKHIMQKSCNNGTFRLDI
jgi:hypothetical protein